MLVSMLFMDHSQDVKRLICLGHVNSSHPSDDCSRHSNLRSLFPGPTILVTKYEGFLCDQFLLWEWQRRFIF